MRMPDMSKPMHESKHEHPADQPYRCDFCGSDYTDAKYCCQRRREYLNAHGQYEPADQVRGVGEDAKAVLWREWAIDGMPKDKQRLAEAAFAAGLAAIAALTQPKESSPDGS
jgi:hypothetical protein